MRRSKENSEYWQKRLINTLETIEESGLVEQRYRTLRYLLIEVYGDIIKPIPKERVKEFLKDVCYLDRELRKYTEGDQQELKLRLSDEKKVELEYLPRITHEN